MKQMKGNTSVVAFTDGKLILINNALLYYNFLRQDGEGATENDPTLWYKDDSRDWKGNGFPLSTKALNASQTGNNNNAANITLNATNNAALPSQSKLKDDAWLS